MTQSTATLSISDIETLGRYRHLLRTADPHELERAHALAFDELTATRRRVIRERLADELPAYDLERLGEEPHQLARVAVRCELRRPGTMERAVGSAVERVAASVVGGVVADPLYDTWMRD